MIIMNEMLVFPAHLKFSIEIAQVLFQIRHVYKHCTTQIINVLITPIKEEKNLIFQTNLEQCLPRQIWKRSNKKAIVALRDDYVVTMQQYFYYTIGSRS